MIGYDDLDCLCGLKNKSLINVKHVFLGGMCCRFATAGPADYSSDHCPTGDHWEGSIWGGMAGKMARGGCGGEDLLLQGREVMVS